MFSDDEIEREYQNAMREQTGGDKRPDFQHSLLVFMATLALFAVVLFVAIKLADMLDSGPQHKAESYAKPEPLPNVRANKVDVWLFAQKLVTARLKNPAAASFGGLTEWQNPQERVSELADNAYRVTGFVDSTNSLGGTLRTRFVLTIQAKENGDLELIAGPNFE